MTLIDNMNVIFSYELRAGRREFQNLERSPIAFFCAEYSIEDGFPNYAGGLGVLAGDFALEAGEKGIPFAAIGLFYHYGFKTYGDHNTRIDPQQYGFNTLCDNQGRAVVVAVEIKNRLVRVKAWVKNYGSAHIFLLDTDLPENSEADRGITDYLYDDRQEVHAEQVVILGVGGVRLLRAIGITPSIYHLNEARTSFAAFALAIQYLEDHLGTVNLTAARDAVRPSIVATKHTILPTAGQHFTHDQLHDIISPYLNRHGTPFDEFFSLGLDDDHPNAFSTTKYLIVSAARANAVSMLHAIFEKREHPHSQLLAITNGIQERRWRSPDWPRGGAAALSDAELWTLHSNSRRKLIDFVQTLTANSLNPETLTVVWARRFSSYKRPDLLFSDLDELARLISSQKHPIQFIVAGLARAADQVSANLLKKVASMARSPRLNNKAIYLPEYNVSTAKMLVAGADIWLSTPTRGQEACGTSSMKSGLNGVLQCSTSDGWIDEVDWANQGWILPNENLAAALYHTLAENIAPLFYERNKDGIPEEWVKRMRSTISVIEDRYTAKRMLEDYLNHLYFPSADTPYKLT